MLMEKKFNQIVLILAISGFLGSISSFPSKNYTENIEFSTHQLLCSSITFLFLFFFEIRFNQKIIKGRLFLGHPSPLVRHYF